MVYSTRSDSNQIYGKQNIDRWADLQNFEKDEEIIDRITWAIQEAYDQINARLHGCRYAVPFTTTVDPIIKTLSARLAGVLLYDNRKLVDSVEYDELGFHRSEVERTYQKIHGGQISLLSYERTAVNYPQAIVSDAE